VDKTCKSNGILLVAIQVKFSGVRVRNTWAICPEARDSLAKAKLIPHVAIEGFLEMLKTAQAVTSG
jgi:hypothetical protein